MSAGSPGDCLYRTLKNAQHFEHTVSYECLMLGGALLWSSALSSAYVCMLTLQCVHMHGSRTLMYVILEAPSCTIMYTYMYMYDRALVTATRDGDMRERRFCACMYVGPRTQEEC